MKEKSFGASAIALAAMGIVAKLIGALYRVPLTNIVGAEGMGLYQMVFPLYSVLLAFCGGGISSALSRVVARYTALGDDPTALRALKVSIVPLCILSVAAAVVVACLRNVISAVQGNTQAAVAYLALSPSLMFAGAIGALRGYFQGRAMTVPSGVSQLIEQTIKLVVGLYMSRVFLRYGVAYAVAGALLGVSLSELVAAAYLTVGFIVHKKRRKKPIAALVVPNFEAADIAVITDSALLKEVYSFALPVTLGSLVLPITQMIDSALVINLLANHGRAQATALFGLLVGPVGTLVNMPTVVTLAAAVAYLPAMTAAAETKHGAPAKSAAKWIFIFIVPVTLAFLLFPEWLCGALYGRGLSAEQIAIASELLRVTAIGVFYTGILQLATAVLQSYGKAHKPVIYLLCGACFKVALTPVLVRYTGIVGAAAATSACYAVAALLSSRSAAKCTAMGIGARDMAEICVLSVFAVLVFWIVTDLLSMSVLAETIIGGIAAIVVYLGGIVCRGVVLSNKRSRLTVKYPRLLYRKSKKN